MPSDYALRKTLQAASTIPASIDLTDLEMAYGAYIGVNASYYGAKVRYTLERLLKMGFRLIRWDGMYV